MISRWWSALLLSLVLLVTTPMGHAQAQPAALPAAPVPSAPGNPADEPLVTDGDAPRGSAVYVVRYKDGVDPAARSELASAGGTKVLRKLTIIPGMMARLTKAQAAVFAADPTVEYVEAVPEVKPTTTQSGATWGLDRIDQPSLPLNGQYTYNTAGAGVKVYVIDSGINRNHADFVGRVAPGTYVDYLGSTNDCSGHGTHVSSTIAGTTWGVAKQATIVPVRIFGCTGGSYYTIAAMDWVRGNHASGTPAVVNLSLGGPRSVATNDAVQRLLSDGVTVVASAGNDTVNACTQSPASAAGALTVAASNSADAQSWFSNYGSCVDLYAPGENITAASFASNTGSAVMDGTSMAAPHASGVAALVLGLHKSWSPSSVISLVKGMTVPGKISGATTGTPNKLLSIAPTNTTISPTSGRLSGGQKVTITGTNFSSVSQVLFGGVPGTGLSVASKTSLTVYTPASLTETTVPVRVVTKYSNPPTSLSFRYVNPAQITAVTPNSGSTSGGTTVTISGNRFVNVTSVLFGGTAGKNVQVLSEGTLRVTAPAHASGVVDVRVNTRSGASAVVATDKYTFVRPPAVSSVSPSTGLGNGGTSVTITGSRFLNVSAVTFGGVPATSFTVVSPTSIVAVSPRHVTGTVDVRVTGQYGTSPLTTYDRFRYIGPSVSSLSPTSGPTVGGNKVTVYGSRFNGSPQVTFGGVPGTGIVVVSSTKLTVIAPAHAAGSVDVQVTTGEGSSKLVSGDRYSYRVPVLTRITPTSGRLAGGTTVTIYGSNISSSPQVTFGGIRGTSVTVYSSGKITAKAPAGAGLGGVDVRVTNKYGTSAIVPAGRYTYI